MSEVKRLVQMWRQIHNERRKRDNPTDSSYWGSERFKEVVNGTFHGKLPDTPPKYAEGDRVRLHTQGYPHLNGWYEIDKVLDPTAAALERPNFPTYREWHYRLKNFVARGDVDRSTATSVVSERSLHAD